MSWDRDELEKLLNAAAAAQQQKDALALERSNSEIQRYMFLNQDTVDFLGPVIDQNNKVLEGVDGYNPQFFAELVRSVDNTGPGKALLDRVLKVGDILGRAFDDTFDPAKGVPWGRIVFWGGVFLLFAGIAWGMSKKLAGSSRPA